MKKGFILNLITLAVLTLSAEARIVRLTGEGAGGTTNGDKQAACDRAYDRAEDDAYRQCDRRDGEALNDMSQGSCQCRKKPGSRDDYNCDATVRMSCDVACHPQSTQVLGNGLGIDFSRNVACNDAFRRAQDDSQFTCSRQDGFVTATDELSCNCRRLNGGDYECRSTVQSTCELNSCR